MTEKQKEQFNRMWSALKMIAHQYETPDQLRRNVEKDHGVEYEEGLEMAYENIQTLAKAAVKHVRKTN